LPFSVESVARGASSEKDFFTFFNNCRSRFDCCVLLVDSASYLEGGADGEECEDEKNWTCRTVSA
jgi:hypothetical protein